MDKPLTRKHRMSNSEIATGPAAHASRVASAARCANAECADGKHLCGQEFCGHCDLAIERLRFGSVVHRDVFAEHGAKI